MPCHGKCRQSPSETLLKCQEWQGDGLGATCRSRSECLSEPMVLQGQQGKQGLSTGQDTLPAGCVQLETPQPAPAMGELGVKTLKRFVLCCPLKKGSLVLVMLSYSSGHIHCPCLCQAVTPFMVQLEVPDLLILPEAKGRLIRKSSVTGLKIQSGWHGDVMAWQRLEQNRVQQNIFLKLMAASPSYSLAS